MPEGLFKGPDGVLRCWWSGTDPEYCCYHDEEWGHPMEDDRTLFEKICLEGFQAGLSWITILRKRDNFRKAFSNFNVDKITKYTDKDIERLMQDAGIVRHRGKIESVINNAARAKELRKEFGSLAAYFWQFEPGPDERPKKMDIASLRAMTKVASSIALSKDLKRRGWSFVGPTTVYAFMQAMGMVNDHLQGCNCRDEIEKARKKFKRPSGL
jgi:DNA-3-methyladenine glycosylase I